PQAGALTIFKAVGLLLVISSLVAASSRREPGLLSAHPILVGALVMFVAWAAISAVWAESIGTAFSSVSRYALNLALFPIVWIAVRRREHVNWLFVTLVFGTAVAAAYGLVSP